MQVNPGNTSDKTMSDSMCIYSTPRHTLDNVATRADDCTRTRVEHSIEQDDAVYEPNPELYQNRAEQDKIKHLLDAQCRLEIEQNNT